MRLTSRKAAEQFIDVRFPCCNAAILAGSVVTGHETSSSDLDLVIIDDSQSGPFRAAYFEFGWPIEVFVLTKDSYRYFFEVSQDEGIPSLQRMCVNGVVLKDDGTLEAIIEEAKEILEMGPTPWSPEEMNLARYHITECLDDLTGVTARDEALYIVNRLAHLVPQFILRSCGEWTGEGKWAIRSLRMFNETACLEFVALLELFYKQESREPLIRFVDEVISPFGGRLMNGFFQGG